MHAWSGRCCMHSRVDDACMIGVDVACMVQVDDAPSSGEGAGWVESWGRAGRGSVLMLLA